MVLEQLYTYLQLYTFENLDEMHKFLENILKLAQDK